MSTEQPLEMHDLEATNAAGSAQDEQVDEHSEPSLAIGHEVFRNRQRLLEKRRLINIILGAVAACLLISTIVLAVLYGLLLRHSHDPVESVGIVTVHHTVHHTLTMTYSQPPPTTTISTSSAVETNVLPEIQMTTVTASKTNIALSPATPQPTQCWPGSVWGGAELKEVNRDYVTLMSFVLSRSGLGRKEIVTDYDLVALRSIFLCGQTMEPGALQLLDVCKAAYVSQGDRTRCDESGSELKDSTLK